MAWQLVIVPHSSLLLLQIIIIIFSFFGGLGVSNDRHAVFLGMYYVKPLPLSRFTKLLTLLISSSRSGQMCMCTPIVEGLYSWAPVRVKTRNFLHFPTLITHFTGKFIAPKRNFFSSNKHHPVLYQDALPCLCIQQYSSLLVRGLSGC